MISKYQVLLFYSYSRILDPVKFRDNHLRFCIENNIVGRIIISDEGINGTVSGKVRDCKKYINKINSYKIFNDICNPTYGVEQLWGHDVGGLFLVVLTEKARSVHE